MKLIMIGVCRPRCLVIYLALSIQVLLSSLWIVLHIKGAGYVQDD